MKYFCIKNKWNRFNLWKLLSEKQIESLKITLAKDNKEFETFTTIQTYDNKGNCIYCPIYADFDSTNLLSASEDTLSFVDFFIRELGMMPKIYFSGNKGFHVIVPAIIVDVNCHSIIEFMLRKLFETRLETIDWRVYTARRMFRDVGSYNRGGEKFKIEINYKDLFSIENVRSMAYIPRETGNNLKFIHATDDKFYGLISEARNSLKAIETNNGNHHYLDEMTPCIKHISTNEITNGYRNTVTYILARYYRNQNISADKAVTEICKNKSLGLKYIEPVVRSTYKAPPKPIGCKNGRYGPYLKQFCSRFCMFHDNPIKLFDRKK